MTIFFPDLVFVAGFTGLQYTKDRVRLFTTADRLVTELYSSGYLVAREWSVVATRTAPGSPTVDLTQVIADVVDGVGRLPDPPTNWVYESRAYRAALIAHRDAAKPLLLAAIEKALSEA